MRPNADVRAFECPRCGRIQPEAGTCHGTAAKPHARTTLQPADELREALELDERG